MTLSQPDLETLRALAQTPVGPGERLLIPVYMRLLSDTLTPVLAYRRLVKGDDRMAPSFLLESVVGGDQISRYSYLGAQPIAEVIARGHDVAYRDHRDPSKSKNFHGDDPLLEMDRITSKWRPVDVPGLPEFTGGWVGYAGYDTVRYLEGEKLPTPPPDDRHLPDLHMQLYNEVVVFDQAQKSLLVITHVLVDEYDTVESAYLAGQARLAELCGRLLEPHVDEQGRELATGHIDLASPPPKLPTSTLGVGGYQKAVEVCKQYIAAGDAFQIVPSQRFDLTTAVDPFDIYRSLRVVNPSPYMFYLQIDGGMLVGSSPEILCKVEDGLVTSRPLAGTRRRGKDPGEDEALGRELLDDAKDRAEHIMLVDLHRNDVGRVAEPGSIELAELMTIERYSHVMHISSTVTGRLRDGLNAWDALRVTLPVGTVSGAPKVRAMQIIDELEATRRGPYGGAVGYADFRGNLDMAIALRTMVVTPGKESDNAGGTGGAGGGGSWNVHIQAGGGIVADSDPDAEHQETVNKAAALAKAVDLAQKAFGDE